MNDFATSTQTISRSGLQGLPQRLVMDGLVGDAVMVEAIAAAKERRVGVVSYLVEYNLADAREIAIAASHEFGAPLMDLDAIQPDLDTVRIVSEKILRNVQISLNQSFRDIAPTGVDLATGGTQLFDELAIDVEQMFKSIGGGTLLDNGCHMMDLARYFGGDVRQIYANTATLGFDVEVEDTSVATLTFASGALGSVENAWTATGWEQAFWVYGTEGSLEYSNRTNVLTHRFRSSPGTTFGEPDIAHTTFGGYDAHTACEIDFLAAVRGERDVVCTGEDGLEAVRLVLAGYESARENAPVRLASEQVPETLPSA